MYYPGYRIKRGIEIKCMYSLFEQHFCDGYSFPGESHDFWECMCVLDGSIRVSGGERVYSLGADDIIFHKPMEQHKFYVESSGGARALIFSFSAEGKLMKKLSVFHLSYEQKKAVLSLLDYMHAYEEEVSDYNSYITKFEKIPEYSQMVCCCITRLFLMLCIDGRIAETADDADAEVFGSAVGFMSENLNMNFSVEDIAEKCHISATGLKRVFKKLAGTGVHKYFLRIKINKATQLLRHGKNVGETAEELGFDDSGYFSKVYKRETGMSPSKIRQNNNKI